MRLFFAVMLPDEVREAVGQVQQRLREELGDDGIKWTSPEQFHFTLKFLGEVPEGRLPQVIEAGRAAASQTAPFTLTLAHVGILPEVRRPQALYIYVDELDQIQGVVPHLAPLVELLDGALAEQGFKPESRKYHPHLTIARIKSPVGVKAFKTIQSQFWGFTTRDSVGRIYNWRNLKEVDRIGAFVVQYFVLVRSELHRDGPIYTVLESFPLSAKSRGQGTGVGGQ